MSGERGRRSWAHPTANAGALILLAAAGASAAAAPATTAPSFSPASRPAAQRDPEEVVRLSVQLQRMTAIARRASADPRTPPWQAAGYAKQLRRLQELNGGEVPPVICFRPPANPADPQAPVAPPATHPSGDAGSAPQTRPGEVDVGERVKELRRQRAEMVARLRELADSAAARAKAAADDPAVPREKAAQLADAARTLKDLLDRMTREDNPPAADGAPVAPARQAAPDPAKAAKVTARRTISGTDYAVVDAGSKRSVGKGQRLKILVGEKPVGTLVVDAVEPDEAIGHLEVPDPRDLPQIGPGTTVVLP